MTPDWTATKPAPFSLEFAQLCARDMVPTLARCEVGGRVWKWEIGEFAKVVLQVMRKEKGN